jgi:hypothetical protein
MIKNLFYNIQLLSSFLLERIKIFYLLLAIILYGSSFFPIILCDEEITRPIGDNDQDKEKQKFWISVGILAVVSAICLYFFIKGIPSR